MLAHQQTGGSTFDRAPGHGPKHVATTSLRTIHLAPQRARAVPWWAGANTPDGTLRKLQRSNTNNNSTVPPSKSPSSPREASSPTKRAPRKARPGTVERPPVRFGMDPFAQTTVTTPAPGVRAPPQDKRPGELNYLPLEMFEDDQFKEEGGMSRNVLLASKGTRLRGAGARAFSKWFFQDGTFEWRRVSVLDQEEARFLIEWEGNGKQKWVSVLNILFEGEEEEVLQERRQTAIHNRCANSNRQLSTSRGLESETS